MLSVISPAKSLDFESPLATKKYSEPRMLDQSEQLVSIMATKSPHDLSEMMNISPKLAELNFERFQDYETPFTPKNARPAVLAFTGDVYSEMAPGEKFATRDYTRAQKSLRILSGLYGLLRPLDLIQPYRLEMGTKVSTPRGNDLYDFWGESITDVLSNDLADSPGADALINLASIEYFSAVRPQNLDVRVISPVFLDSKNGGEPKIISFFAKRARGSMAQWLITERVGTVKALREFNGMGYRFDATRSTAESPVFLRSED